MSRAFVKELDADYLEELPERPVSEHPNDVTAAGLAQIEHALAAASEAYAAAQRSADRAALAAAGRSTDHSRTDPSAAAAAVVDCVGIRSLALRVSRDMGLSPILVVRGSGCARKQGN
jgi:hypothetical protein